MLSLLVRQPPTAPLFPYTTLFRSHRPPRRAPGAPNPARTSAGVAPQPRAPPAEHLPRRAATLGRRRSEEHTSELQSPCNLVCRLLLEKKKQKYTKNKIQII